MSHSPSVLIVGAGPVGMALAIELGRRGIDCLIIDRSDGKNDHPRANVVSPRSMEHFRRWGIDEQIIDAGLPRDYPTNIIFTTRLFDKEIARFSFPSITEARRASPQMLAEHPAIRLSPYFKTAVGQNHIEPVLRRFLGTLPSVRLELQTELIALEQTATGARCTLRSTPHAASRSVTARYVVACDGARSTVRSLLGIEMTGQAALGQNVGVYFRAPGLVERFGRGGAILYWTLAPNCTGVFIAINGRDEWVLQRHLLAHERVEDFDARRAVRESMGADFPFDVVTVQPWVPRQLVADAYRKGDVFLAGDAAHLLSPTGGFGMNTGIGDAVDIGWKLAAVLQGWGGAALLDSYEAERRPIAWRNAIEATDNREQIHRSAEPPAAIEDDGPQGDAIRAAWAERLHGQRKHFAAAGIHLGYRYENSPVIVADGTPAPSDDPMHYVPVARPGSRAPHLWLNDERSTLDLFGPGFTLLRLGPDAPDCEDLARAARELAIPFEVVDLASRQVQQLYGGRLVLVRPDGHVAWRSDTPAEAPQALLRQVTGRA